MNKLNAPYIYVLVIITLLVSTNIKTAEAQNNTRSPYSMYGIGELKPQNNIVNSAMGNAGIAISTGSYINMLNPAAYQGIDSLSVIFDTGIDGKYSTFDDGDDKKSLVNGNYSYIGLGFRLNPSFAFGLGLTPYSSRGYEINSSAEIEGTTIEYPLDITGTGDLTRAYFALSYAPLKNLSFGVKSSFLFGKLDQTQYHDLSMLGSYGVYNLTTDYFYNFFFEFGAQYQFNIKNTTIGLGAIYTPSQNLDTHRETATYDAAGTVYDEDSRGDHEYILPEEYGIGISINDNKHFNFVLDLGMQKWGDYTYDVKDVDLTTCSYIRTGLEYTPSKNFLAPYFQRVNYRAGFRYTKDYIKLREHQLEDIAASIGFGFPVGKSASRIDLSIEGGSYGTNQSGLIKENYCRVRLGFSLHDVWFQIRKFN